MLDYEELRRYKQYLNTIQKLLDGYFENQKEYLYCKKGCSHCCEKGAYPYSKMEFDYLLIGFFSMDLKEQQSVIKRIQELKAEYEKIEDKTKYMYRCPFLNENGVCTVYNYRGLICRTFGLLKPDKNGDIILPFCQGLGLNYSDVYNREKKILDPDLMKDGNYKNTPKAYDLSFKTLMDKKMFESNPLDFGEIKSLVEWL